jgi:predicted outer membrane protein
MRNFRILPAFVVAFAAAALLSGCQQSATAPQNPRVSQTDLDFITGLTNLAEFDHRVIRSELHFNPDPRVKDLALDLQSRIEAFRARVQPVAIRNGIQPPATMTLFERSDMHSRIATLMATSKYDFDQEFLDEELHGNQEVLRQAEQVVAEPSGDPEMHALAVEAVGRLKDNIRRLQSLQVEMRSR